MVDRIETSYFDLGLYPFVRPLIDVLALYCRGPMSDGKGGLSMLADDTVLYIGTIGEGGVGEKSADEEG